MNIRKFFAKNLPGGIGGVAKTQAKVFSRYRKMFPCDSKREILIKVLLSRLNACPTWSKAFKSYSIIFPDRDSIELFIDRCENKLSYLIMSIIDIEYPEYFENVINIDPKIYLEVREIILEAISTYAKGET